MRDQHKHIEIVSDGTAGDKKPAQDGATSSNAKPRHHRRDFLIGAGVGALALLTPFGIAVHNKSAALKAARKSYGTLDNPLFKANPDLPYSELLLTYRALQERRSADLPQAEARQFMDACEKAEKMLQELEQRVSSRRSSDTPEAADNSSDSADTSMFFQLRSFCTKVSTTFMVRSVEKLSGTTDTLLLETLLDQVSKELKKGDYRADVGKYGSPEAFVRNLTREITGRELPKDITFEIRDIDNPQTVGLSRFDQSLVVSENMNYTMLALVFAHEVGHLMAQHQEDYLGSNPGKRTTEEVYDWEEACAYAFEAVTAAYLIEKCPELQKIAKLSELANYLGFLEEYYSGKNTTECHRRGMAIFDAAYTTLGSLAETYNFLISHRQLTPEMQAVLNDNLATQKTKWEDNLKTPRKNEIEAKLADIERRVEALAGAFGFQ